MNRFNMMKIDKPEGVKILKVGDELVVTDTKRRCSECGKARTEKYWIPGLLFVPPSVQPLWPDDVGLLRVCEDRLEIELTDELSDHLGVGTITQLRTPQGD